LPVRNFFGVPDSFAEEFPRWNFFISKVLIRAFAKCGNLKLYGGLETISAS
jgi:hypothetical protein